MSFRGETGNNIFRMKSAGAQVFCCLLVIILSMVFSAAAEGLMVGEVEVYGLTSMEKKELLYLLKIDPGEPIDAGIVRKGIKRAFLKGIFEDISVETLDEDNTRVIVRVKERDRVKKIHVEGDFDLSVSKLRELFLIREGQVLPCNILDKAIIDLKPKLAYLGYPRATVEGKIENLRSPYSINMRLFVNTGQPEIIKNITISGAGDEIREVLKLSPGDVYDQSILKKDLERIKSYYKKNDYFRPVIESYAFVNGTLFIALKPGERLRIKFKGNDSISEKTLLREMPFFTAEDFGDAIVEEAVQRIFYLYRADGYFRAQVAPVVASDGNLINLTFFVSEGPQARTGDVVFAGNTVGGENLQSVMSLKPGGIYNPDLIDADMETLGDYYNSLGYLKAEIQDFEVKYDDTGKKMNITVRIDEGLKTLVESVNITGAVRVSESELLRIINIKPGDPYNDVNISDARVRVLEFYGSKGFPDITVSVKSDISEHKASITFQVNEGEIVFFGKTIITGNKSTKYRVIERELLRQEDLPFDFGTLARERQRLYKLGLFSDVDMEVLDRYEDKRDVLIKLREGDAGSVEFGLGYSDYERYRGFIDLSYRNLWGMNRQSSLRFELSYLDRRLILQYYEPWFWDRPIPFRALLLNEERKEVNVDTKETLYRLRRNSASAGFERKFSEKVKGELYYEFSLVETFDVQPDIVLSKEDTGTLIISGLRLGLIYDSRDSPFYASKGILSGVLVKLTSPLFLSETDFVKLTAYGNVYHELMKGIVLAASIRGGLAEGYNDTAELPIVERFFLGGRTTIRGYEQDDLGPKGSDGNPTGGNVFLMENLEMRISIGKGLGIVLFLDGGNVWQKISDIVLSDMKYTTGLGLRYNTPVGPLRVDYGHKLDKEKGESSGEVHFSIGHAF
jgi:outer membrane protein insertion porin family